MDYPEDKTIDTQADLTLHTELEDNLSLIAERWAEIAYVESESDKEDLAAIAALTQFAAQVVKHFPERAEPLVWHGKAVATEADLIGGIGAIKLAEQARELFEASLTIDETVVAANAHTSLGVLFSEVPEPPLGFGSQTESLKHFKRALSLFPDDIEVNYYYGLYLEEYETDEAAREYLQRALTLSENLTDRTPSVEGRQEDITEDLEGLD